MVAGKNNQTATEIPHPDRVATTTAQDVTSRWTQPNQRTVLSKWNLAGVLLKYFVVDQLGAARC